MHLSARLEQLNNKLDFAPGKTGVQLMDSVDDLVKFAYANKNSSASKGAPQTAPASQPK
jgi:hypothetical protein